MSASRCKIAGCGRFAVEGDDRCSSHGGAFSPRRNVNAGPYFPGDEWTRRKPAPIVDGDELAARRRKRGGK